ncbi:hypothetical protein [Ramlibacter rhizophilus]|uniref:NIPSNAP domain-containing protein n=1 Tax=Ramlibacter rhizophilus TaxID=1781167 RepID=A0A4Z0BM22_9BURK|nr:hypothetical protein [Ramlibacter rhizophilus]TFY99811.1 hypothetical protein EZ242_11795 [Ramlibacter rhizophilus]
MYTFIREVSFKTMADMMRGLPVAQRMVKHYKEVGGVDIQIQRALSGSPVCVRFVAQLDSLDEWQRVQSKIATDPEFHKMLGEMGPLVDGGRTNDQLWQS